jgi:3-hydroxybutyryl-CoA dehydratase
MTLTSPTLFFEDLGVGQRASLVRTVRDGDLQRMGDPCDESEPATPAEPGRFGQRVAEGVFTTNLVSAVVGTKLPGPGAVFLSQTLQYLAPVRIGDVVTAQVEIVELVPSRHRARLFCECICNGRPVLEGEAWVAVDGREAGSA